MKKKPSQNKGAWYILEQIVWSIKPKALILALPEDIETVEDINDLEFASLPISQIRRVLVTGKFNKENNTHTDITPVEMLPDSLEEGMHISKIKLPIWLGKKNEMFIDETQKVEEDDLQEDIEEKEASAPPSQSDGAQQQSITVMEDSSMEDSSETVEVVIENISEQKEQEEDLEW